MNPNIVSINDDRKISNFFDLDLIDIGLDGIIHVFEQRLQHDVLFVVVVLSTTKSSL
jgi:hypothetical protein